MWGAAACHRFPEATCRREEHPTSRFAAQSPDVSRVHEILALTDRISWTILSYVDRSTYISELDERFAIAPVVALLGPRQVGKTTLARMYCRKVGLNPLDSPNYFDLENPLHVARLQSPMLALQELKGLVVIDEVQRTPDLFQVLRVLVDRDANPAKFLILGSASRDLIRQSSETLAGRISFVEVTPFSLDEVPADQSRQLWLRGGLPRSFLAQSDPQSLLWRNEYVQTFLERDIPALGITIPPTQLRRMWMMLAHCHGQILNVSDLGSSLGIADSTARRYVDLLTSTFVVRNLPPWFENIGKRQVKRPKVYIRDSGLLHALLGIANYDQLLVHPKLGRSWEGFALEEIIRAARATPEEAFFWAVHQQAELDLLIVKAGTRLGFEIKYTDRPTLTPSMRSANDILKLDSLTVVGPLQADFLLAKGIHAKSLDQVVAELATTQPG